ncbi:MAG: hypothetical protein Fur0020_04730 [Thermodesulfovibrionia bacterium]
MRCRQGHIGDLLSREERLIIDCLRLGLCGSDNPLDSEGIKWDELYRGLERWHILPLFDRLLKRLSPDVLSVPSDIIEGMRLSYLKTSLHNEKYYKRLIELLNILNMEGIKVALLKGSHLLRFVYQDIGIRQMVDIDILVKRQEMDDVERLMLGLGYRHLAITNTVEWFKRYYYHLPFIHPDKTKIEVHWSFTQPHTPFCIDTEGLWMRAEGVKINGVDAYLLSPEDTLLYLCLHASHVHRLRNCIRYLCDIVVMTNNHPIDWDVLIKRANEWAIERYLYITMFLAYEVIGLNLPQCLWDAIDSMKLEEGMVMEARRRLILIGDNDLVDTSFMEKLSPSLSLGKRLSNIFHTIFISPDELVTRYRLSSSRFVYLYYIHRILSLFYHKFPVLVSLILHLLRRGDSSYNLDTYLFPRKRRHGG